MSKPLWRGPWIGKVGSAPIPSSGTWEIPLASLTGYAAAAYRYGAAGDKLKVTDVDDKTTSAVFSSTMIKLNGGAETPIASLPAGFSVTLARLVWGKWNNPDDEGGLGGACGQAALYDGAALVGSVNTNFAVGTFNPVYILYTYPVPPALVDLQGREVHVVTRPIYPGGFSYIIQSFGSETPRLYGNYEVS